jgi:CubicO group peptidase (beta-lactamase class C family)
VRAARAVPRRATGSLAFLALTLATAQRSPSDAALAARIDALARPEATAGRLSGVILVARDGRVVFQRAYGFADWERRVPASPSTRFNIASITKAMTTLVAEALAGEGRLDLDAPVARYLPGFPTGPAGGVPTVRQLLAHQAGVPHRVTDAAEETQPLTPADIVERVRARGLRFEPGTQTLYSSAGFTCLARVIEVVERQPFDSVLAARIFRPAAMTSATGETGQRLMPGRALPYRLGTDAGRVGVASAPYKHLGFLTGAGEVYATAEDLQHVVDALRTGVFGPAARAALVDTGRTTWRQWYGRTNGYEASLDFRPAGAVTVVLLSNLQSAATWQLRAQALNLVTGQRVAPIRRPPAVASPSDASGAVVGQYGDRADPVTIAVIEGKLFRDDNEFYPIAGGAYYIPASGSVMRFERSATGAIDALVTVNGAGRETRLPRVASP